MLTVVPRPVSVRVPAKVNLHLAVGDRRDDGYHDLTTVFHAVSLFDEVTIAATEQPGVEVHGDWVAGVPTDKRNLAWQAVLAVAERAGRSPDVRVVLRKAIPVAGGMAGGSADAAGVLVGLPALWRLDLPREEVLEIAAALGSDVTFALHGGTALGTGRGDTLVPVLARHPVHWVVALHDRGLPTPQVYGELDRLRTDGKPTRCGAVEPVLEALAAGDPRQLAFSLGNDLQAAAVSMRPELRRTLRAGVESGALAGVVSGSGPSCAFLCEDADAAVRAAAELAGAGVCRTVRVVQGPVAGARVVDAAEGPPGPVPPGPPAPQPPTAPLPPERA